MSAVLKDSPTVVTLVRYRSWLIPKESEDYLTLRELNFPSTKIHEEAISSIALLAKRRNVRVKAVRFLDTVFDPYFEQLYDIWCEPKGFRAQSTGSELQFWTTRPDCEERAIEHFPNLEKSIRAFMVRWGFETEFHYSESRGKHKLVVTYRFSKHRKPEIPLKGKSMEEQKPEVLLLGNHRILLSTEGKWLLWRLETRTGDDWAHITGSRCLVQHMEDPGPFFGRLLTLHQQNYEE